MYRKLSVLVLLAITSFGLYAAEPDSNEELFEDCKTYERFVGKPGDPTASDAYKANTCVQYMAGAFQIYNFTTAEKCDLSDKSPDKLIRTFLGFVRESGQLSESRDVTVFQLLENCFCNKDPAFAQLICPVTSNVVKPPL